ncbi:MAG: hypothetical protein LBU90_02775 [Bacteroidales bacterium]|nr:hypothetical protein [Bacteroidales bacterium]
MPYLYNKKVTLVIIPTEDTTTELKQRKLALKRLLKQQAAMPKNHLTDEELDDIRYNRLQAKQI